MSTLGAITALVLARPAADAPTAVLVDWFKHKASVLLQIAADSTSTAERGTYETFAARVHQRALQLLGGPDA